MVTVIDNKTTSSSKDPFTVIRNLLLSKIDNKRYLLKLNKVINEIELYKYKIVDIENEEFDFQVKISPDNQNCNFLLKVTSSNDLSMSFLTIILSYKLIKEDSTDKTFSKESNAYLDQCSNLIHALISSDKENIKLIYDKVKFEMNNEFKGLNFIIRELGGETQKTSIGLEFNIPNKL